MNFTFKVASATMELIEMWQKNAVDADSADAMGNEKVRGDSCPFLSATGVCPVQSWYSCPFLSATGVVLLKVHTSTYSKYI